MAKHKKTRQQKISADARRKHHSMSAEPSFVYTEKEPRRLENHPVSPIPSQPRTASGIISVADYRYLAQDLRKIVIVTTAIIVIQLILHFVVKI